MSERRIAIVGAGEIGHAMAHLLTKEHIVFWDRDPAKVPTPITLAEAVPTATHVLLCVPTAAYEELIPQIATARAKQAIVVALSKGLLTSGQTIPTILSQNVGDHYALLAGPMIAEDILADRPAFATIASPSQETIDSVSSLFEGTLLYTDASTDVSGVAMVSVLKNIFAFLFGIADGLELGDNARGWIAVEALKEMRVLLLWEHASPDLALGLAGLGDLITTGTSMQSNNHETGRRLAQGNVDLWNRGEGIRSIVLMRERYGERLRQLPLLTLISNIVQDYTSVGQQLIECFQRYGK